MSAHTIALICVSLCCCCYASYMYMHPSLVTNLFAYLLTSPNYLTYDTHASSSCFLIFFTLEASPPYPFATTRLLLHPLMLFKISAFLMIHTTTIIAR